MGWCRLATCISALVAVVDAHGWQMGMTVNNGTWVGLWNAQAPEVNTPAQNITYRYDVISPTYGFNSSDIACSTWLGGPAIPQNGTHPVKAGDNITIYMSQWVDGIAQYHWGPILVYMADCNGDCATFNTSTPGAWFKIYESGWLSDTQQWATQKAGFSDNSSVTFQLPSALPSGKYLLRPDFISLQFGPTNRGAQSFPACHALSVEAVEQHTCLPTQGSMATFPGEYNATAESLTYIIWTTLNGWPRLNTKIDDYKMPGTSLASFACAANAVPDPDLPDPSPGRGAGSPDGGTHLPAILGGTIGGVVGILLLLLLIWCCCYRRQATQSEQRRVRDQVVTAAVIAASLDRDSVCGLDSASYAPPRSETPYRTAPSAYSASEKAWSSADPYRDRSVRVASMAHYGTPPSRYARAPNVSTAGRLAHPDAAIAGVASYGGDAHAIAHHVHAPPYGAYEEMSRAVPVSYRPAASDVTISSVHAGRAPSDSGPYVERDAAVFSASTRRAGSRPAPSHVNSRWHGSQASLSVHDGQWHR